MWWYDFYLKYVIQVFVTSVLYFPFQGNLYIFIIPKRPLISSHSTCKPNIKINTYLINILILISSWRKNFEGTYEKSQIKIDSFADVLQYTEKLPEK